MSDKPKKSRKRESLVKRYCFTWNNYDDESLGLLKDTFTADNCRYAICGLERGENGTHHIQGYIHLKKAVRFTPFKKMLGGKAHIEKALGSDADNKKYCGKEGNVFLEVGCVADNITERGGKPYSIQRGVEMAKVISTGVRATKLLTDEEAEATYFMYRRNIHSLAEDLRHEEQLLQLRREFEGCRWYRWQGLCLRAVDLPPHKRRVTWYYDVEGNSGKTFLSRYLVSRGDAIRFENGRSGDIKYAYNGERIVIFDFSRSQEDHINYEIIETIKNGIMLNTKYECKMKVYPTPHVIVMANFEPDKSKLSFDRWDIQTLSPEDKEPDDYVAPSSQGTDKRKAEDPLVISDTDSGHSEDDFN